MHTTKQLIHHWSWILLIVFFMGGMLQPVWGLAAIACMLAPVVVAFFKGRKWCGTFCPRGSFNDMLLSKISRKIKLPAFFRASSFRIAFMLVLLGLFMLQIILAWGNLSATGTVFLRMVFATTVLTIVLGAIFNQRTWCMICPMGTMAHYVSVFKAGKS